MVRDALDMMTKAGAIVEEISIPMHSDGELRQVGLAFGCIVG